MQQTSKYGKNKNNENFEHELVPKNQLLISNNKLEQLNKKGELKVKERVNLKC